MKNQILTGPHIGTSQAAQTQLTETAAQIQQNENDEDEITISAHDTVMSCATAKENRREDVCPVCSKELSMSSNKAKHVKKFHPAHKNDI